MYGKVDQEAGVQVHPSPPHSHQGEENWMYNSCIQSEGAEALMITCQLSHTAKTDKLHYQAFVGDINSARAFQSMEAFRKKEMI